MEPCLFPSAQRPLLLRADPVMAPEGLPGGSHCRGSHFGYSLQGLQPWALFAGTMSICPHKQPVGGSIASAWLLCEAEDHLDVDGLSEAVSSLACSPALPLGPLRSHSVSGLPKPPQPSLPMPLTGHLYLPPCNCLLASHMSLSCSPRWTRVCAWGRCFLLLGVPSNCVTQCNCY